MCASNERTVNHKHSNYLFTRVCQLCHRAINRRRGRNDCGCVDKVTARRQQRAWTADRLAGVSAPRREAFQRNPEKRARPVLANEQGKKENEAKKKKLETMKLVRGGRGQESQPVPGRAAGLWLKRSWCIHLNERRAGGRAKRQWCIKTSKFRKWEGEKTRWKRERELHFYCNGSE